MTDNINIIHGINTAGVKSIVQCFLAKAGDLAKKSDLGKNFTDHREKHSEMVAIKALEAADAIEKALTYKAMGKTCMKGRVKFEAGIDKAALEGAAISHDTGMSGTGYALDSSNGSYSVRILDSTNFDVVRCNHPFNSALNVLSNRTQYTDLGYTDTQVDIMAVECMIHSKSCSGVSDLNSMSDWQNCFARIEAGVAAYNRDHPDHQISFNRQLFLTDTKLLGRVAAAGLALRIGDVSRDSGPGAISQVGEPIYVDRSKIHNHAGTMDGEIEGVPIVRGADYEEIQDFKSRRIHAGEQNISYNRTHFDKTRGYVIHEITVRDSNSAPKCTQNAIQEHLGELRTARDEQFIVHISFEDDYDDVIKEDYTAFRDNLSAKGVNYSIIYPWDEVM